MAKNGLSGRCAIIGYGDTPCGRFPERSVKQTALEAAREAIQTAGVEPGEIDGIITTRSFSDEIFDWGIGLLGEELRIKAKQEFQMFTGGASSSAMLDTAVAMIEAGMVSTVLLVCADAWGSENPLKFVKKLADLHHEDFERPYAFFQISAVGLIAQKYMHDTGTTPEQFASVAVSNRAWAALNPKAMYRKPITVEDVLKSRMVCSPFHLLETPPLADGGAALVVTGRERAKKISKKPVFVKGVGHAFAFSNLVGLDDLESIRHQEDASRMAYEMAGIGPKDIHVASIYEPYPVGTLTWMEALGFCKRGEAGAYFASGATAPGGEFPVTTDGGMLSRGHAAIAGGMMFVTEAVRQLRGEAGERQVKGNPTNAVATAMGGVGNSAMVTILGRES